MTRESTRLSIMPGRELRPGDDERRPRRSAARRRGSRRTVARCPRTAGTAGLQLPLVVAARGARGVLRHRPRSASSWPARTRCGFCRRSRPPLCAGPPATAPCSSGSTRSRRRSRRIWTGRPIRPSIRPGRSRSCAPSTASMFRCRCTRAAWVRWPATCSRRPPTALFHWWRSGSCTARATSASGSTRAAGSTSTGSTPTPLRLPAALVTGPGETPLKIEVPIYDAEVTAQIWRVDVGRVPLFLLDTDVPENGPVQRWITARLYEADEQIRLAQYVLLGAGGVRALTALGFEPGVLHLNEGHAVFAPVQLAAQEMHSGEPLATGITAARERTVFTTHTPVPAGNDTYTPEQVVEAIGNVDGPARPGSRGGDRLGRTDPEDDDRAVRRHPGGVAHEPRRQRREPPPRPGGARDVAGAVARSAGGRGSDRPRDQRRARSHLDRHSDARAVRPPPGRGMDGARGRARDVGSGGSNPRRGALGGSRTPACRCSSATWPLGAPTSACSAATSPSTSSGRPGRSTPASSRSASPGASPPTSGSISSRATPSGRWSC